MKLKLSIVIPTFNEKDNIRKLIPLIERIIQKNKIPSEIIVVDDNSPDGTANFIRELNKRYNNIRVIVRKRNKGLAPSLLEGFNESKGEFVATMDSDLCHDPNLLKKMMGDLENNRADIIVGSRYLKESTFTGKPIIKKFASKSAQAIANFILGLNVKDTTNNFRVFKNEVYKKIKNELHPTGNIMLTEFLYLAKRKKFKIKEIPIHYAEKREDKTRLNLFRETIRFVFTILKIRLK